MVSSPLRVGVIGCGFFAENHLSGWSSMDDVVLAAVCDLDIGKAQSAAERHGASATYSDAAEMLDRERLDFVDIATTMESHAKLVGMAAARNPPTVSRLTGLCLRPMNPRSASRPSNRWHDGPSSLEPG